MSGLKRQGRHYGRRGESEGGFRLKPVTAWVVASIAVGALGPAWAADEKSVSELQAEVARLRAALQASESLLAEKSGNSQAANESLAGAGAAASSSAATTELEAVVIRRQSTVEKLQEETKSVSAVSGEELERLGATNITEVLRRVGNVQFNYGNPRTGSLTMRGITTGSSDQIDPSIGTVLDGVSLGYTPLVNGYIFVDIDTAEVSRGPQGSAGGKQASIGGIRFKTKAPSFTPEAEASITLGEWNTLNATAIVGGPVVDGLLAWRGTFRREQADGPWNNQFPDLEERGTYQNVDRNFGRVQFLLTPTDNFNAKLSVERQPKGGEYVNGLSIRSPQPATYSDGTARPLNLVDATYKKYLRSWFSNSSVTWDTARDYYKYPANVDNNGSIMTSSTGETLNLDWTVAGHRFESITGHRTHWFSAANDEGTPYDITKSGGYITEYKQKSQEFRILSDKNNKLVDYVAGLFYLSSQNDSLTRTRYGSDAGAFQAAEGTPTSPYNVLIADGTGQALLRDSLNLAYKGTQTYVNNKTQGAYAKADWHLAEPTTLTTGYRFSTENRETSQGVLLLDPGVGGDLTTAFGNSATTAGLAGGADAALAADRLAQRYFGSAASYATLTPAQQTQLIQAARVRNGTLQPGSLYGVKAAPTWQGPIRSYELALAQKFGDNFTLFGSYQYGEKGGMSQISTAGVTSNVEKERINGYELGFRASTPGKTLFLNANVFLNDIRDFQTTVYEADPVQTAANIAGGTCTGADCQAFASRVGNLPGVRVKGLEVDAFYTGIQNFNFRIAAAYNDARYSKDTWLPFPNEQNPGTLPASARYYNAKGDALNNAPKFQAKLGFDYRLPVFGNKVFHASANYAYTTSYQTSSSIYDKMPAHGILDLGIGIGRRDGLFDINLIAKNALDEDAHVAGWDGYTPRLPRWLGVTISTKL
ncbi:TonB-dependent receptor [Azonexus sp. R2A61]|uniref:TonB-dependent receptor n=1 Tax=Azonexus sp. R2A61 TaxID=2744443 RepID=UPI001F1C570C|nr:TonB-dependent receptor [Azonexus sp. R2A61]